MKTHIIPWIKENKGKFISKVLEVVLIISTIVIIYLMYLNNIKNFTSADVETFHNLHSIIVTEEGEKVIGTVFLLLIAEFGIPIMYAYLWLFRLYKWYDMKELKMKITSQQTTNNG